MAGVMIMGLVVLAGMVAALWRCLRRGTAAAGWVLLVLAAMWEPLSNGRLEGRVLLVLGGGHGLTVADLWGLLGFAVASWTAARPHRVRRTAMRPAAWMVSLPRLAVCAAVFAAGAGLATVIG